jgi:8-oxo-dGTP pyrophosphatase MutT (NUDIX family)
MVPKDDDELLDVLTADGRPTGVTKLRADVHRDGDWHRCVFVWIVRHGARGPELLLQRRAATKATWPGRFDASVAGHLRAGEAREDALREVEEELGIRVHVEDLVPQPGHAEEHALGDGRVDREHHDVSLLLRDDALETYRPSALEVSGLVSVPTRALAALAGGLWDEIPGLVLVSRDDRDNTHLAPMTLRTNDLVPYGSGYLTRLCASAEALLAERAS